MEFQTHTFPNGLTVVGERNPEAKSLALGFMVRTGARDEAPGVSGVSHFLEHMLFKGSDALTPWDINREFDEMGAKYNAFTSEEVTAYHGAVLPEEGSRLLRLLAAMMRPALRPQDFEVEKKVILEEIEMYKDRPGFRVFDELRPAYFRGHPLGNSVLGSPESIAALTRDDMAAYFERRYAPNNLLLALAGNYDWEAVLEEAQALTESWAPAETGRSRPGFQAEPSVRVVLEPEAKVNRAHLAFMAPGYGARDSRRHAASVLGVVLGDDEGSRLYWRLVDTGLAEAASLAHDAGDGLGSFSGYVVSDPERAQEALDACREVLAGAADGVGEDELERARRKVSVSLVLRAETPYGRLFPLGLEYLDTGEYTSLADSVRLVGGVSLEDVNAILADRPFERLTVVGLGPIPGLA